MDRQEALEYINQQEPTFLEEAPQKINGHTSYICPVCGNGSGASGTGIALDIHNQQKNKYKCFKCGISEDIAGLFKLAYRFTDDTKAFNAAYQYYNISIDNSTEYQNKPKTEQKQVNYMDYFRKCADDPKAKEYFLSRGISEEVIKKYYLGYDGNYTKSTGGQVWQVVIIPTSPTTYTARNTNSRADVKDRYRHEGGSPLFNTKALTSENYCFITEGAIDALSIITVGGEAVALGSTANYTKLLSHCKNSKPLKPLIIALDNDEAGQEAAEKLQKGLQEMGIISYRLNPYGEHKDANEALTADKEAFTMAVHEALKEAEALEHKDELERKEAYLQNAASNSIEAFKQRIEQSKARQYIKTGFKELDTALDGGLFEGLYIIGAISSLGKTTFCLQIADNIAKTGSDVLIFSLEMSQYELMAKSISRLTYEDTIANKLPQDRAKTTRNILDGARYNLYSPIELDIIDSAIKTYSEYANNIYFLEGIGDIGITQVREAVQKHKDITGKSPVVLIDYLQILAPYNDKGTDKQNTDKAVLELKRISRDFETPVIGISSFNRENYTSPVSMASFKESGAIEFSADVLLGLQYYGMDYQDGEAESKRTKRVRELMQETIRKGKAGELLDIQVKLLKNRNASKGDVLLNFCPKFNYFCNAEDRGSIEGLPSNKPFSYAEIDKARQGTRDDNTGVITWDTLTSSMKRDAIGEEEDIL